MNKTADLTTLPIDELVRLFANFSLQQDTALFDNDIQDVNHLFRRLMAVAAELKSRPGDQRRALLTLLDHENPQVKIKAAKATLAIAPVAARKVLEQLSATCHGPQRLEAGMALWFLDRGVFKPT